MSSGNRRLRINTQERAVSSDINRLQQFANQDSAEMARYLLNVRTDDDDPGVSVEDGTVATPLGAQIINGFMVKPQSGNLSLFVDPGVLYAMAPDAAVDDSNYKYVRDAGISSLGLLLMTANSSGDIRIDVIECRINPVELVVADSRDIFDPTTGLFSATSVTKELSARLEFRVRAGTPASGMPAHASGWLPLCVASVPDGTTSNDTITFWDVRPLVSDRARGPMATSCADQLLSLDGTFDYLFATRAKLIGSARAILNGREVGGQFRKTVPGSSVDYFDPLDADNQDTGTITDGGITAGDCVYIYVATPFVLPRWARYTDGPSGRVPQAPKGILVASLIEASYEGNPVSPIAMPASTGLGATTTAEAMCVALCPSDYILGRLISFYASEKRIVLSESTDLDGAYNVLDPEYCDFHIDDKQWSRNVKRLWVNFQVETTIAGTTASTFLGDIRLFVGNAMSGPEMILESPPQRTYNDTGAPITVPQQTGMMTTRPSTPLISGLPYEIAGSTGVMTSPRLISLRVDSGLTLSSIALRIHGFEL